MMLDYSTGTFIEEWQQHIFDLAFHGCVESAVEFYRKQPNYTAPEFEDTNKKCAMEFTKKVASDISQKYIVNMMQLVKAKHCP